MRRLAMSLLGAVLAAWLPACGSHEGESPTTGQAKGGAQVRRGVSPLSDSQVAALETRVMLQRDVEGPALAAPQPMPTPSAPAPVAVGKTRK
jgi:hypothetical protein